MRASASARCVLLASFALSASARAQTPVTFPPSITLPNYNRVPIGQMSSLEGGAFVARANDSSANWYNPAGLALADKSSLSANATLFESTSVTADGLGDSSKSRTGASVPAFLGNVLPLPIGGGKLYGGFSITQPISWAQAIDTDLAVTHPGSSERLVYAADTSFSRLSPGVALGYAPRPGWRVGIGASVEVTDFASTLDVSDRAEGTGGPKSILVSLRGKGSVTHARLTLGTQVDVNPDFRIGAVLRTPGLRLQQSGSLTFETVGAGPDGTVDILFRDQDAEYDYKLPLELWIGASYKIGKAEVELDLKGYNSVSSYVTFGSNLTTRIITTEGPGTTPVVATQPFAPVLNSAKRIVNVALGARLPMKKGMLAHLGFFTDLSPAPGPPNSTFQKINLYGLTLGGSRPSEHFTSSFGFVYIFGSSDPIAVADLESGASVTTKLKVRSIGFIYSASYRF